MSRKAKPIEETKRSLRCAIYTRKSTEEGLEQEFNSLDAQREAAEAFIKSQHHEGWKLLSEKYDDGGFTGGNIDRPALRRLLTDIELRKIDIVLVYKVDRLSRSLLDFAKLMESFERHKVSFVSITQQFNSATSMGRLVLNVLLSFAQFEREIISERTRDKIAATRRKGKWSGGMPILGYDVLANTKLSINHSEAEQVREIFKLYLKERSLLPVVQLLNQRGWTNKRWRTRRGTERGGKPFSRTSLYKLLTNITYIGRVRYKQENHVGEHPAIIDRETWSAVQTQLSRNGRSGGTDQRNSLGFTLKGLIHCAACGCRMTPSHSLRQKTTRYRYYICSKANKFGWNSCPGPSVPAGQIEKFIADRIQGIGRDPALRKETIRQVREQERERKRGLETELSRIDRDLVAWDAEIRKVLGDRGADREARLADLNERIRTATDRRQELLRERATYTRKLEDHDIAAALKVFEPTWNALTAKEQGRILRLLIERVDYHGSQGKIDITFHAAGLKSILQSEVVA